MEHFGVMSPLMAAARVNKQVGGGGGDMHSHGDYGHSHDGGDMPHDHNATDPADLAVSDVGLAPDLTPSGGWHRRPPPSGPGDDMSQRGTAAVPSLGGSTGGSKQAPGDGMTFKGAVVRTVGQIGSGRAAQLRVKAADRRAVASSLSDPVLRRTYLEAADNYDREADGLDRGKS